MNNMDKLGDIELFAKIVKHKGLAAAGREQGLSPASTTARLNRLEENYGVRLLNRTTRSVTLTAEGRVFYESCMRILADLKQAEERLTTEQNALAGRLKVTAPIDLGRTVIGPLLREFVKQHPKVSAHLTLNDHIVNLIEGDYDLAIRYSSMQDSSLISRTLASNKRVLCASPKYLEKYGLPLTPEDLHKQNHRCLAMVRDGQYLRQWGFNKDGVKSSHALNIVMSSNDGTQTRQWALDGAGIALKPYWDIRADLKNGKLISVLEEYNPHYKAFGSDYNADLKALYISREFMPERTRAFLDMLVNRFTKLSKE